MLDWRQTTITNSIPTSRRDILDIRLNVVKTSGELQQAGYSCFAGQLCFLFLDLTEILMKMVPNTIIFILKY